MQAHQSVYYPCSFVAQFAAIIPRLSRDRSFVWHCEQMIATGPRIFTDREELPPLAVCLTGSNNRFSDVKHRRFMLYRSYKPVSPLREFIEDLWLSDDYSPSHFKERIVPSGTIELVINLREDELRIYDAGRPEQCERYSGALVSGPYSGFFVTDTAEENSIMGVHFKPGGGFPFTGIHPGELTDTHVDLQSLWGRSIALELRERLCLAATVAERFRLLEEALLVHLSGSHEHHYAIPAALAAFQPSPTCATVRQVARGIGLSQRRFIEVFKDEIGLTPKLFSRMQRFHEVLAVVERTATPDWARLALDCGYFDQSHLIRDFTEFTGFSPTDYLRQQAYLKEQGVKIKRHHVPVAR